jgi:hypothetical protein
MTFYTINQEKHFETLAFSAVHREQEIFQYDVNIANYEAVLTSLPQGDWPENLVQYQHSTPDQIPDELDQTVLDYQYRDRLRYLLKTERIERSKSFKVYEALLSQLPADQRETLIMAAHTKITQGQ